MATGAGSSSSSSSSGGGGGGGGGEGRVGEDGGVQSIADTAVWARLQTHADEEVASLHLRELLQDEDRCAALRAEHAEILLDYSRQLVTPQTMDLLFDLADAAMLEQKRAAMGSGEHINTTENRAVMHVALRSPPEHRLFVDGENVVEKVHEVRNAINAFANKVRDGTHRGASGKRLTTVVSIGIGGSYLGPEFVHEALRTDPEGRRSSEGRRLRFLANVDPVDVSRTLEGLDPETTLVVIVSKTFTTAETMLNARSLKHWLIGGVRNASADNVIRQHMVAVSANVQSAQDFGIDAENIFGFWDWVGGRYSVCSAVGLVPLTLQYGPEVVGQFLGGAHDADRHFFEAPLRQNLPVLMGLLGVWNSTFLGHAARAILPYSQALQRFPAHIQQVDMESNGKRVAIDGSVLPFEAGEINFGEPGTNGQHSFYQLIHQGRVIPCEFIGFCQSPNPIALPGEQVVNHDELMSNFFAQPDALAMGKTLDDLEEEGVPQHLRVHKEFPGNRPSFSLLFGSLTAFSIGQLLALYEHRTAVQGFIWNINSFDQWGVELGKVLAKKVRKQLNRSRVEGDDTFEGFNPSTSTLLQRYLAYGTSLEDAAAGSNKSRHGRRRSSKK